MKNIYFGDTNIKIILDGDKLYLQNLIFENYIGQSISFFYLKLNELTL